MKLLTQTNTLEWRKLLSIPSFLSADGNQIFAGVLVSAAPKARQNGDQQDRQPTGADSQHCNHELGAIALQEGQQQRAGYGDEDRQGEGHAADLRAHTAACSRATVLPVVTWQATIWPASYSVSAGSITSQTPASNSGQRGWKVQAGGRFSRLGMFWFCKAMRSLLRVSIGSASGTALSRARV